GVGLAFAVMIATTTIDRALGRADDQVGRQTVIATPVGNTSMAASEAAAVGRLDGVVGVRAGYTTGASLTGGRHPTGAQPVLVNGIDTNADVERLTTNAVEGRFPAAGESGVLLPRPLAVRLDGRVGDTVTLVSPAGRPLHAEITGIVETTTASD